MKFDILNRWSGVVQFTAESLAIVDHMVALAKIRGWKMSAEVA